MSEIQLENDNKVNVMLISSIVFGIMFQFLFYGKVPGISITAFIFVFYGAFYISLKDMLIKRAEFFRYILMVPIIVLSLTYALYTDPLFMFFNVFIIAALIAAQTLLVTESEFHPWYRTGFAVDLLRAFFYRPFAYFLKPFIYLGRLMDVKVKDKRYRTLTGILIGLAVTIPILVVVLTLLSSADMIFNSFLGNLTEVFRNISIGELLARGVLAVAAALLLFSYLWSISTKRIKDTREVLNSTGVLGVDPVIVITVLAVVDAVYLLFTFIQFTYLFGSLNLNLPSGYTYAEYARKGFFELVMVTVINLAILLAVLNFTKTAGKIADKFIRILNTILVGCTIVMLFSAHFRMAMYEDVYGYTYLRLLTHAFMLFIFVLLIITLIKVWYVKLILLKWYLIIAITAYTIVNFVNVNAAVAKNNIDRFHKTEKIDVYYLTSLSFEAVPYTVELYNELKGKDAASAAILGEHLQNEKDMLKRHEGWQSFNYSRYRARKIITPEVVP